jgi:hypothetical protein
MELKIIFCSCLFFYEITFENIAKKIENEKFRNNYGKMIKLHSLIDKLAHIS